MDAAVSTNTLVNIYDPKVITDREREAKMTVEELDAAFGPLCDVVRRLRSTPIIPQKSDEWLKMREDILTASDVASAIGQNKYKSKKQLFQEKIGQGGTFQGSIATRWGQHLEDYAALEYEMRSGCKLTSHGLVIHDTFKWLGGSVDGIVATTPRGVEIKCPYSDRPIDTVPEHYIPQVQVLMDVLDIEVFDFVQFKPPVPPLTEMYTQIAIRRDREWFKAHVPLMRKFMDDVYMYKSMNDPTLTVPTEYKITPRVFKTRPKVDPVDNEEDHINEWKSHDGTATVKKLKVSLDLRHYYANENH